MTESPGSVVTLLCSGIRLYNAERRIADCILADLKQASISTSAELARASHASEATVTRLCHKLGFENYRKFQIALARDVLEQQQTTDPVQQTAPDDPLRQSLERILANRQEELRATYHALELPHLRAALAAFRTAEVIEIVSSGLNLPVALDASMKFSGLGKRCVSSAIHEKTLAFAQTLTPKDLMLVISSSGRSEQLELTAQTARKQGAPILLITCDRSSPLAQLADHLLIASNREQRLLGVSHLPSQLSPSSIVELLYYLLLLNADRT